MNHDVLRMVGAMRASLLVAVDGILAIMRSSSSSLAFINTVHLLITFALALLVFLVLFLVLALGLQVLC